MSAPTARTVRPSPTTAAGTGTARSVRPTLATVGSKRAVRNFSPRATSMLSSPYPMSWRRSPCRTRKSCTICCCRLAPKPSSKSPAIPNISAPKSASSLCSTPGIRSSNITPTPIVWCPPADCRPITLVGFHRTLASFFPSPCSEKFFRRKFVIALKRNFRQGKLGFHGTLKPLAHPKAFSAWLRTLYRHHWHIYSKRPFGGAEQALRYLGRYTHRVAISNHRLVSFVDDQVTFLWRDRAHNNQEKLLPLSLDEFLRRFLLHVLPKGFVRIRHFGFLANRRRATFLPLCLQLLGAVPPSQTDPAVSPAQEPSPLSLCPKCGGRMVVIERLTAAQIQLRSPPSIAGVAA